LHHEGDLSFGQKLLIVAVVSRAECSRKRCKFFLAHRLDSNFGHGTTQSGVTEPWGFGHGVQEVLISQEVGSLLVHHPQVEIFLSEYFHDVLDVGLLLCDRFRQVYSGFLIEDALINGSKVGPCFVSSPLCQVGAYVASLVDEQGHIGGFSRIRPFLHFKRPESLIVNLKESVVLALNF